MQIAKIKGTPFRYIIELSEEEVETLAVELGPVAYENFPPDHPIEKFYVQLRDITWGDTEISKSVDILKG